MGSIRSVVASGRGSVAIGSITVGGRVVEGRSTPCVRGSGVAKTEQRSLEGLPTRVVTSTGDVSITVGQATSLEVTADDNLLAMLRTEVGEDALRISFDGSVEPVTPVTVRVCMPSCERVSLKGVGTAALVGLQQDAVQCRLSGSGSIRATGRVEHLKVKLSGAGSVDASQLVARSAKLDISGAGNIEAHVTDKVEVSVSGVGEVNVSGNPPRREVSNSGVGTVRWR